MPRPSDTRDRRVLVDEKVVELALYAKQLCPDARVEMDLIRFDDEDGHVRLFPEQVLSDAEQDRIESYLAERAAEILEHCGVFILCGVLDTANGAGQ